MIVLTGGNGQLGRAVGALLEAEPGAGGFRLSVRDPAAAADRAARGIEVRPGDFDDPPALARSFEGAEQLVLISADGMDEARLARQLNAVRAAAEAGVGHIVFTSTSTVGKAPGLAHAEVNARTEDAIAASGAAYTILRSNLYAELLLLFARPALATGVIRLPAADGRAAMISRADLAAVIARALRPGFARGRVYEITGPSAHGYAELAGVLSATSGRPVRYEPAGSGAALEWLRGRVPVPDAYLPFIVDAAREFGEGWLAPVSEAAAEILGRVPTAAPEVWRRLLAPSAT